MQHIIMLINPIIYLLKKSVQRRFKTVIKHIEILQYKYTCVILKHSDYSYLPISM